MTRRISIDRERCIGSGNCALIAPEVFELGADGLASVIGSERGQKEDVERAVQTCPTAAIEMEGSKDENGPGEGVTLRAEEAVEGAAYDDATDVCAHVRSSFDHHSPEFIADPFPKLSLIRQACPVIRAPNYGGYWLITRYDDVLASAKNWQRFTSSVPNNTAIPSTHPRDYPDLPIEIDPPEHGRYRQLISPVFSRAQVERLRTPITRLANRLVQDIAQRGGGDVATDFAVPMSVGTLAEFMQLPHEDRMMWVTMVDRMMNVQGLDEDARHQATQEYVQYIDRLIADRKSSTGTDFISRLLESEVEGTQLSDEEIRSFAIVLLIAGHETTAAAMGMTLHHLAEHPDDRRRLFASPELYPTAVEEFLRLGSPIMLLGRNAVGDMEMQGQTIPDGDAVALVWGSANRDETQFPDPDHCILDRNPNRHVAFGWGPHLCAGAHVARLELTIMLEQFARYLPEFRLDPGSPAVHKPHGHIRGFDRIPVLVG